MSQTAIPFAEQLHQESQHHGLASATVENTVTVSDPAGFFIAPTGSIQDSFLEEAIVEAYAKHGHKLAGLISAL